MGAGIRGPDRPAHLVAQGIEKVKSEAAGKPCPDCGKVHDADHDGKARAAEAVSDDALRSPHTEVADEEADEEPGPDAALSRDTATRRAPEGAPPGSTVRSPSLAESAR